MPAIRTRFTGSFVLVAISAMLAFAFALWIAGPSTAQEQVISEATDMADHLLIEIRAVQSEGNPVTVTDSTQRGGINLSPEVRARLDLKQDYFIVIGTNGQPLYTSRVIRMLPVSDGATVFQYGVRLTPREQGGVVALVPLVGDPANPRRLALVARGAGVGMDPQISRVVAGLPNHDMRLTPQVLFVTAGLVLPFVFLAGLGAAYGMGLRAFQPMGDLTNQLEAITDGRSLHRRLPPDTENDELGRLTTTLNAMLSRLELSFAGLRRFTADASHELKTPLAVLRADVERAMHPRTTRDDRLIALEESLQEVTRMSDLVDSLLTLARADEGRFELVNEAVHTAPLLRDVFETASILGETSGLSIGMPANVDAVVMGERTRLRQLLLNLITNAIKYTPRGGRVEVSSTMNGASEVSISVRDTGIGISATDLPHVFDRFWRADRARSRAVERSGFGLGLAISQYIAQAHGGALTVQSRLGRGTLFTVILPTVSKGAEGSVSANRPPAADLPEPAAAVRRDDSNSDFTDS